MHWCPGPIAHHYDHDTAEHIYTCPHGFREHYAGGSGEPVRVSRVTGGEHPWPATT